MIPLTFWWGLRRADCACVRKRAPSGMIQSSEGFNPPRIKQSYAIGHDEEHPAAGQLGDGPAHSLKCQAEVVGDVVPRHGQGDCHETAAEPSPAFPQANEESCNLFIR